MANLTKGLKKLRKRVKKLAAEVADLRAERNPAPAAEAVSETAPATKPARARTNRTSSPRTRRRPATTASR
jgi:cell division protein FtsB